MNNHPIKTNKPLDAMRFVVKCGLRAPLLAAAIAATVISSFSISSHAAQAGDVLQVIGQDPAYSTFSSLLQKTGVIAELKSGGSYTVFAPSNEAFDELPADFRQQLLSTDSAAARRAMSSLVVNNKYLPQDIAHNRLLLTSVGGAPVVVDGTEGRLTADGTEILSVDTSPSNGVIYTIDGVSLDHRVFTRDAQK